MVSASLADNRFAFLGGLGFQGSLADRERSFANLRGAIPNNPIYLWGNSLALTSGVAFFLDGEHYSSKIAKALNTLDPVTYAVGGRRIADACYTLINGTAAGINGLTGINSAGKWTGASARPGLLILDSLFNDVSHSPNVTASNFAALPTANQNYLEGLRSMYRTALVLMSSESRIESSTAGVVRTGTWALQGLSAFSNADAHYTSTVGDNILFPSVTPPQSGPLAGKVFFLTYRFDVALSTAPVLNVSVDGGANVTTTPTPWEQYIGQTAANFQIIPDVITVTLPVDGAAHSVRVTHAGAAGNLFYADAIIIPSVTPSTIAVMERMLTPVVNAGGYTAPNIAIWKGNRGQVNEAARSVVEEFPNAIWVREGRSTNGLYSGDGVHSNSRGTSQDAAALLDALDTGLVSNNLRYLADSNFAVL